MQTFETEMPMQDNFPRTSRHPGKIAYLRNSCSLAALLKITYFVDYSCLHRSLARATEPLLTDWSFGRCLPKSKHIAEILTVSPVRSSSIVGSSCRSVQMSGRGRGRGEYYKNKYGRGSSGRYGGGRSEHHGSTDDGAAQTLLADQLRSRGGSDELNSLLRRLEGV